MSEEIETAVPDITEPVGDPIVKHCAMCGVQFRQMFFSSVELAEKFNRFVQLRMINFEQK